ncbi:MAG: DUF2269 family protein [Paracoccaceae bacterium]
MTDPYLIAKWLHILSSTLLFGTGIGTAFQMVRAMATRDARHIHATAKGVVLADWLFTVPSGIAQPLTGLWLIHLQGWSLTEPWLLAAYALYLLALVCWLPVAHLQIRIRDLTRDTDTLDPLAMRLYRIWFALGWPAFLGLIAIYWLMVAKPPLAF